MRLQQALQTLVQLAYLLSFCSSPVLQKSFNTLPETPAKHKLFIVVLSDKGLCGSIHSSVTKATHCVLADLEQTDPNSPVMVIGDKSMGQLACVDGKNMPALAFNQIGCDIPTFADAAGVANLIVQSSVEYDSISIVYNKFLLTISYEPTIVEVANEKILKESHQLLHFPSYFLANYLPAGFHAYKMEDDFTKDLAEFSLANAIYFALVKAHACEQNAW